MSGEICKEAIEAADEINDAIDKARVGGNWDGVYTLNMATIDNAIRKAKDCKAIDNAYNPKLWGVVPDKPWPKPEPAQETSEEAVIDFIRATLAQAKSEIKRLVGMVDGEFDGLDSGENQIAKEIDHAIFLIPIVSAQSSEKALWEADHVELAEWRRIKKLFREEAKYRNDSRNAYAGHSHSKPGIWDSDNGPLAGHECAACAAARAALVQVESKDKK
jgi:hypothetical protein